MSYSGKRKIREGLVVSNKMDKTVVVAVETRKVHPLYKKAIRASKKYKAHDENSACKIGDRVRIEYVKDKLGRNAVTWIKVLK